MFIRQVNHNTPERLFIPFLWVFFANSDSISLTQFLILRSHQEAIKATLALARKILSMYRLVPQKLSDSVQIFDSLDKSPKRDKKGPVTCCSVYGYGVVPGGRS